ncbi:AzlD domain-containing protein [Thalassobaculum sp.]|uniref:AzlD domain-containing protein n=1 Tax=Thalassobaculum sp. TaxID=2022740 RepID=UPI0032EFB15B
MTDLPHAPLTVVLVAAAATFVWRALGAILVDRIDPEGAVVRWFTLTSYALLAALVVRLVGLPTGSLGGVSLAIRLAAVAVTLGVWWLTRRNPLLGVLAGTACFIAAVTWTAGP